jgi:hypothetical protein
MRRRVPRSDPYQLLGVSPGASRAEIRRAYRRRAMTVHPDVAGPDTTARMAELNAARDELLGATGAAGAPPSGADDAGFRIRYERPVPPDWSTEHGSAWTDHWSAWNDPPRRDRPGG